LGLFSINASPAETAADAEALPREDLPREDFAFVEPLSDLSDFDFAEFLAAFFFDMRLSEREADSVCGVLLVDVIIVIVSLLS
jgi:hypothetical protein